MAIIKFDRQFDFSNRFVLHPSRSFSSGSGGVTGSVRLTQFKQGVRRSIVPPPLITGDAFDDASPEGAIPIPGAIAASEVPSAASTLLSDVSNLSILSTDLKTFEIERFT
ncbi:MAG: hypothetical protein ACXAEN_17770, partial [Candidatus Thorarchaeota archaeon]